VPFGDLGLYRLYLFSQCSDLRYFTEAAVNNGKREKTKQGMLRSPVGAIDPDGSSCVSIFTKRSIGTAM